MVLKVTITDRAMRDRLADQMARMRGQIAEMAERKFAPRSDKSRHHRALLASARSDLRDLARSIREFDRVDRAGRQRENRKGRGVAGSVAKGQGGDGVAKPRTRRTTAKVHGD